MKPLASLARSTLRSAALACAVALIGVPAFAADEDPWPALKTDLFGAKTFAADAAGLELEAPYRAEDAAIVPITVKIPASLGAVKSLTLVVDKNPAPMAASFTFGPAAGTGDRSIATRLRFDSYSNLRAVVEKADGTLLMVTKFVKAAGGCSAPALKDADEAIANLGKSQVKLLASPEGNSDMRSGLVMVRHPNYSGMQMNQETGLYIPAKYVSKMDVSRGGEQVFRMEAGISISADPNIRFTFTSSSNNQLAVTTTDSDGNVFTAQSAASGS
ncbi:MAG: quinoprotein dehydrogenase-associated SoxYZ-like carrier [Hyphomicrobiaceae bacterium]